MQAVLSRVHRIVVPPESSPTETQASAEVTGSASPPTPPPTAPNVAPRAVSAEVRADIALAVERLQFATLLGERKKAVNALQSLAQQFDASRSPGGRKSSTSVDPTVEEQELGDAAVPAVLAALVSDPRDTELMEAMLEFLQSIVSRAPSAALLLLEQPSSTATWGTQTCLALLQDPSPWIRGPAIALVRALQDAQPGAFAKSVLECKEGLRRLLEVVEDRREHIRDAALAVLGQLTGRDKNAQQFLAFEEGFARLFQIMEVEGLVETGPSPATSVIADCLQIVNNMVRDNLMTQTLFLEMSYLESHVPRLLRLPGVDGGEEGEDAAALSRRKRVLKLGLQLVRFLVAGLYEGSRESSLDEIAQRDRDRKGQELARIQSLVARQEALMGAVGELVCCRSDALTDLRLQALDLLRLVSEHNGGSQMILVNLYASPSGRNVLAELVNLDVGNESDESPVAAASSALLDSLFQGNEGARMAVLQHIQSAPPPPMSAGGYGGYDAFSAPLSAGRVLLDAFICNTELIVQCSNNDDTETINNKLVVAWKASHRLAGLLSNSSYCKELALRVPAEYADSDARAVAGGLFLSRCLRLLRSSTEDDLSAALHSIVFQAKLSVLLLLIQWCYGCPKAVREIVGSVANLSVLVDSLSDDQPISSSRGASEMVQLRGLTALLLGCCLEFLCEDKEEQALKIASTALTPVGAEEDQGLQMTRDQLLQMISKRVGLERFTDALVKFQQSSALIACARASKSQSSRTLLAYRATYDISDEDAEGWSEDIEAHYLFMLYERYFTAFYREMAEQIQKRVIAIYTGADRESAPPSGVDSGAPSAVGAYQDLIRMQDKQIHDLQRQVEDLKQRVIDGEGDTNIATSDQGRDNKLLEKLSTQREQFEREKADLENKIKSMSESAVEMETRVNGLTMAYEQLEREHQQRGQELAVNTGTSPLAPSSGLEEQISALQAELGAERETNRRLQSEATAAKGGAASQAFRDKSDAELGHVRVMNQLEEMRVENEHKNEQLAEYTQMLETLTEGQTLVKQDNERLKAQLAEALSRTAQAGEADETESKSVVDSLMEDKARLERRVEELEAAARAAYEKDQEVLRQRIQEVEDARRASPPVSVECAALETALPTNNLLNPGATVSEDSHEVNEDQRLKELVSTQLEELKELRALVVEMETVARERETQVNQASFLQELVAGYDVQSRRDKEKFEATVRELEDELARAFLENKDAGRKAKAAVKELENEVARLFLAKVELEKELTAYQQGGRGRHAENGEILGANGSFRTSIESENSNNSTVDDLLVLVASLEIQCSVLRESLKEVQGEDAVAVAIELSRQRGAVVSV
ncbi:hypothetical protein PF011_g4821 [Phytophthora fragariae]|uniref:Vesicle tethering protein Uso1/P115-like head domain-containing protein n=1 Tax=Phytophthora fragariae TaxID=53985 RepID=A0A6A3LU58_9STRA|nr:hypothetical protein PF011_g4821 [Phytophthora fragariae]